MQKKYVRTQLESFLFTTAVLVTITIFTLAVNELIGA